MNNNFKEQLLYICMGLYLLILYELSRVLQRVLCQHRRVLYPNYYIRESTQLGQATHGFLKYAKILFLLNNLASFYKITDYQMQAKTVH